MMRSDEVQGSRSPERRRSAKVSSGFPLTIVPVPGVPSGTSGNKRRKESGLSWVSEPELRLINPHPVKDDPQLAGEGDLVSATLRDYARLGLMLAHDGAWNGHQIVPRDWVVEATTANPERPHLRPGRATPQSFGYG